MFSMACLISRGDTFVLTGGKDGRDWSITSRVSLYSSAGWVRDLASLNTARALHGCASYTDSYGLEVRRFMVAIQCLHLIPRC